ncbi:hypothetical protein DRN74_03045 [Candidatus Micrarchaeota archaeon]|nr:MAG: hypothetical protein DRN74_03045 [Candidatus Micrarchaeota archaeon]
MTMEEKAFADCLREIVDPETGKNIVDLGIVKQIEVNEEEKAVDVLIHLPHHMRDLQSYIENSIEEEIKSKGYKVRIEIAFHTA